MQYDAVAALAAIMVGRLPLFQAHGQTRRQAQPFGEIRLTWRWALCSSHYKTKQNSLCENSNSPSHLVFLAFLPYIPMLIIIFVGVGREG